MGGVAIVRHGMAMLWRNLGPALRISLGPLLIAVAVQALLAALGLGSFGVAKPTGAGPTGVGLAAGPTGAIVAGALVSLVAYLFAFSWAAVAWHRFILKEEAATGLLPPLRPDLVWPYLGRSVAIALVLLLIAIPASFVLALVAGAGGSLGGGAGGALAAGGVAALGLSLLLGWVGTRLSLTLPARAVERPMTFGESWAATAPASGAIFVAVLILAAINVALGLAFTFVLGGGLAVTVLDLAVRWITTMLGLSILTTLYGHLVERRPLG